MKTKSGYKVDIKDIDTLAILFFGDSYGGEPIHSYKFLCNGIKKMMNEPDYKKCEDVILSHFIHIWIENCPNAMKSWLPDDIMEKHKLWLVKYGEIFNKTRLSTAAKTENDIIELDTRNDIKIALTVNDNTVNYVIHRTKNEPASRFINNISDDDKREILEMLWCMMQECLNHKTGEKETRND